MTFVCFFSNRSESRVNNPDHHQDGRDQAYEHFCFRRQFAIVAVRFEYQSFPLELNR
jgi:hypothetical protein